MKRITRQSVLTAMINHIGKANGVRACDLVAEILGYRDPEEARRRAPGSW